MSLSYQERKSLEEYQKLMDELALKCTCTPLSDRPCAGLMAGGLCDDLHMGRGSDLDDDENEDYEDEQY